MRARNDSPDLARNTFTSLLAGRRSKVEWSKIEGRMSKVVKGIWYMVDGIWYKEDAVLPPARRQEGRRMTGSAFGRWTLRKWADRLFCLQIRGRSLRRGSGRDFAGMEAGGFSKFGYFLRNFKVFGFQRGWRISKNIDFSLCFPLFLGFPKFGGIQKYWFFLRNFKVFWSPMFSKLGSMLDLVLGGPQDRFWTDFGRFWEAKMRTRRPKMALRRASTEPRRPQDGSKTLQRRLKMHPRQLQIRKCRNLEKH